MTTTIRESAGNWWESKPENVKTALMWGAIALGAIIVIGSVVAAYCLNPSFHSFVHRTFLHIQHGQMSIGEGLLYVGLPMAGTTLLVIFSLGFLRKHLIRRGDGDFFGESTLLELKKTFNALKPRAAAIMGIVVAALAVIGVILYFLPMTHSWIMQDLGHQITQWQGLLFTGGGAAAATLLLWHVSRFLAKDRSKMKPPYDNGTL